MFQFLSNLFPIRRSSAKKMPRPSGKRGTSAARLEVMQLEARDVPAIFSISNPIVTEGGLAVFSVQHVHDTFESAGPSQPSTIALTLNTRDGSARAGEDYQARSS